MKNQIIVSILCLPLLLSALGGKDDLTGTQWRGVVFVPQAEQGVIRFKKDTLFLLLNHQIVETESCRIKGDTLVLKKISGASPCTDEVGYYRYQVRAGKLTMTPLQDDCSARTTVFSPDGYQQIKN